MTEPRPPVPLIIALYSTLALLSMTFTISAIASPYITLDLGGDRYITSYALAYFGFGAAITIPISQPLAIKFGIVKVFLSCLFVYWIGSLLSALAPTYFFFISARLLTGMASGILYLLLIHSLTSLVSSSQITMIRWIFVTILVVTPVVGAALGGTIAYLYNWRALFYLNCAIAIFLIAILYMYFKEARIPPFIKMGFDWIGWCFYALGLFCFSLIVSTAQQLDWYRSPLLVATFFVALPSFGYYLLRSFTHETPVFHLRLLALPIFSLGMLSLAVLFSIYFGMIILLSIWLTFDAQFTPDWIAILIGMMGIAGLFPRFIIEEQLGRIDPRILIAIAALLLAISCFYTAIFDFDVNFGRIAFSRIIAGFGVALFLPSIFQIVVHTQEVQKFPDVFAMFQTVRNASCALGASIFTIVWQRRSVFYRERLSEKLNVQSEATQIFFKKSETLHVPGDPLAQLNQFLDKRASSLALDDVFYLMGWILVGLLVILILSFLFKRHAFKI